MLKLHTLNGLPFEISISDILVFEGHQTKITTRKGEFIISESPSQLVNQIEKETNHNRRRLGIIPNKK